jgi:hypothetical protein
MKLGVRTQALSWLAAAAFMLAACAAPTPAAVAPVEATEDPAVAAATADALIAEQAQAEQTSQAAAAAATLAAQPTDTATPLPTDTATNTPVPTRTPKPTSTDVPPTDTPTATQPPAATEKPAATKPPVTAAPTNVPATVAPTQAPAPASIYSQGSGPDGFYTAINCNRGGAECTPVMPPSDLNFDMALGSGYDSPWGLFMPYGLAVARDGVNVPDMFMFVDAGWLEPGSIVWFGASRNFTVPGRYTIRSSGCFTISDAPCGWANFAGDIITFVIQP